MAKKVKAELPPKEPRDRAALERAIMLLGERAKGLELTMKLRRELISLVGGYPPPPKAANWKLALKTVRDDECFDQVG